MRAESRHTGQSPALEVATLMVRPGAQRAFESAFEKAERVLAGQRGYLSHDLQRSVGHDQHCLLLIEWRSLEDAIHGFRGSLDFERWRLLLEEHLTDWPSAEYFQPVTRTLRSVANLCD